MDNIPSSIEMRKTIQEEVDADGTLPLLEELKSKDPEYFAQVDTENPMRVQRAIEVIRLSGEKYSDLRKQEPTPRPFKVHRFVIDHDRKALYDRINLRVDLMMEAGLLKEVESVQNERHFSSLNTVGYKELFSYLDGDSSKDEAVEKIKQNSRRYAKRQLTWLRRHPDAQWLSFSGEKDMVDAVLNYFEKNNSSN